MRSFKTTLILGMLLFSLISLTGCVGYYVNGQNVWNIKMAKWMGPAPAWKASMARHQFFVTFNHVTGTVINSKEIVLCFTNKNPPQYYRIKKSDLVELKTRLFGKDLNEPLDLESAKYLPVNKFVQEKGTPLTPCEIEKYEPLMKKMYTATKKWGH